MDKQFFLKRYSDFFGEPVDRLEQIEKHVFTGEQLLEFTEFMLKKEHKTPADLDRVTWPFVAEIRPSGNMPGAWRRKLYSVVLVSRWGDDVLTGAPRSGKDGIKKSLSSWFPGMRVKDIEKIEDKIG